MSICIFRRKARVEVFTLFSLNNTFARVPFATSSGDSEERAIPQPSSVDGLGVTEHHSTWPQHPTQTKVPSQNGHPLNWYPIKGSVPSLERATVQIQRCSHHLLYLNRAELSDHLAADREQVAIAWHTVRYNRDYTTHCYWKVWDIF